MARPLIAKMEPALGQPLIIDYRPGAGATVAAQATSAAAPMAIRCTSSTPGR